MDINCGGVLDGVDHEARNAEPEDDRRPDHPEQPSTRRKGAGCER